MIISVCSHCKSKKSENLSQAQLVECLKAGLDNNIKIQQVKCLAACEHAISVGITDTGKASYLFGHISSNDDVRALIEFTMQYKNRLNGWTNASERPKALYKKTIARIPTSLFEPQ
ncbi:DUF1636 family protein [Curvivirga aplysinae]|uniref:DUF1636 family protein n=1 Tax=Curvivirga aplysinae TaxID=2529852 RepID=UPI0012BBDC4F|nr:DUF1636 family protein [Curvivirga aplysinae]MTI11370.1 DUF1636 domain-containing protein [Curvivirga aplysinae]